MSPAQDIGDPSPGLDVVRFRSGDQAADCGPSAGAAVGAGQEMALTPERHRADGESAGQQRIADGLGKTTALWQALHLQVQPGFQIINDRARTTVTHGLPLSG